MRFHALVAEFSSSESRIWLLMIEFIAGYKEFREGAYLLVILSV